MKKCPYCSAELLDDAEFCLYCMKQLTKKEAVKVNKKRKNKWPLIVACLVIVVTLIIVLIPREPDDAIKPSGNTGNNSNNTENTLTQPSDANSSKPVDNTPSNVNSTPSNENLISSSSNVEGEEEPSVSGGVTSEPKVPEDIPTADPSLFRYKENPTGYTVYGLVHDIYGTDAIIPESYNGVPITEVGEGAFYTYTGIKTAYIPKSVTKIGVSAFSTCYNLTDLVIPEGVVEIENLAFTATAIEHLVLPSTIKTLGYISPFTSMKTKIITMKCIPNSLPSGMFGNCTLLERVDLPEGLKKIGSSMFLGCESLKTIDLPESITAVELQAFENCWRLASIDLKNTETLGNKAFLGCAKLKSISISKKMKKIGSNVFSGCTALTDIYYNGTKAEWKSITKNDNWNLQVDSTEVFGNCTVHCVDGDIAV